MNGDCWRTVDTARCLRSSAPQAARRQVQRRSKIAASIRSSRPHATTAPPAKPAASPAGSTACSAATRFTASRSGMALITASSPTGTASPPPYTIYPGRELRLSSSRAATRPPVAQVTATRAPPPARAAFRRSAARGRNAAPAPAPADQRHLARRECRHAGARRIADGTTAVGRDATAGTSRRAA